MSANQNIAPSPEFTRYYKELGGIVEARIAVILAAVRNIEQVPGMTVRMTVPQQEEVAPTPPTAEPPAFQFPARNQQVVDISGYFERSPLFSQATAPAAVSQPAQEQARIAADPVREGETVDSVRDTISEIFKTQEEMRGQHAKAADVRLGWQDAPTYLQPDGTFEGTANPRITGMSARQPYSDPRESPYAA